MFNDARMGKLISTETAVQLADEITASVLRNPGALISLVRLKKIDDYTYMHSVAVCAMMVALGRQLNLPDHEVRDCGLAGLLHDVGKMAIPVEILNKPGRLTESEYSTIQAIRAPVSTRWRRPAMCPQSRAMSACTTMSASMAKAIPMPCPATRSACRHAWAPSAMYDAITSNRLYKEGWSPVTSLARMTEWTKEGQSDATLFAAFVRCIGIYPIGTLVRLKSDRLAVVLDNRKSLLAPIVRVIYSLKPWSTCHRKRWIWRCWHAEA
jgi:HD-GYP domain-containing protein (c-di-GMP phosphodiesterase class II)